MTFRLLVGPSSGALPTTAVNSFGSVNWRWPITGGEALTFNVPGDGNAAPVLSGLASDVWLYEDTVLRQRFRVLPLTQDWDEHGGDSIAVQAVSYGKLLSSRHLHAPLAWTNEEQGEIMWDAIAHTQALPGGNLGITKGDVTTGIDRDRTWAEGDNIGKLFNDLEQVINGPIWRIDGTLVFTADDPDSMPTHIQPLQRGVNAVKLSRRASNDFANSARYTGSTEHTTPVWTDHVDIATDPRGRWEVTGGNNSVTLQDTVAEGSAGLVADRSRPAGTWRAVMDSGRWLTDSRYEPGMFVTVVQPPSLADPVGQPAIDVLVQVTEVSLSFDQHGAVDVAVAAVEV